MSTVIKMIPKEHATKRTTAVIITNDGIIRTRVEDPAGTLVSDGDKQFNFSTYAEGIFREINIEPVISVAVEKIGTNARFIITVNEFYDPTLVGENAPQERFLWYDYKTKADEAPSSTAAQTFPINTFWTSGGSPAVPTIAFPGSYTDETIAPLNLYTSLANVDNRRNYLKQKIRSIIESSEFHVILAGNTFNPITQQTFTITLDDLPVRPQDPDIVKIVTYEMTRRKQNLTFWLEMLTRAISADINLNTEAKFNLLNGEISLPIGSIIRNTNLSLGPTIAGSQARNNWAYFRLGTTAGNVYTPPHNNNPTWAHTADTSIDIAGAPPTELNTLLYWMTWLRS